MNGIIHVCSHPDDDNPHFRITEEQIFKDILHYIEVLFRIVRPQKVFFMAVDGVAPRAKMNQQRGRRFRSAKEAEDNIKKAIAKGEMLPKEKRFDSNCITPGTKFMVRLQEQLEYFVKSKVTTDPAWQEIRIYLSGHETPGEGEHKIMEFIRHERMQKAYDHNTRHCLYGLDADLMMLGLCSHEPHFALLREEVRFTGKKKHSARIAKPEETTFHLLHLSLMREYIDHEFESLKETLPFQYDLESVIDDWVLMGFLVGNDFIPHLPHLHIAHDALPLLYRTYMEIMPTLDGYLNEGGVVNLERFGQYLNHLAKLDLEKFEEVFADFKWLESKRSKGKSQKRPSFRQGMEESRDSTEVESSSSFSEESIRNSQKNSIKVITDLSIKQGLTSPDSDIDSFSEEEDKSTFDVEFQLHKKNYYQEKLHFNGTKDEVMKIAFEYVLAIQWICHYYYNGVQSWSWYYPYHYAPYLSDIRNIGRMKLKYDMAKPFLPYEQLLAVLPAASKECLPEPFWDLMSSSISPIMDYYPTNFVCDLNGKQQEWEAVVLIPFIDENRLLDAMQPCLAKLRKSEKDRNKHTGCQLYIFDNNIDYFVKTSLVGTFPDIIHCKARQSVVPLHAWTSEKVSNFVKGLLPGCLLSVYYPGFPTMYHLPHKKSLQKRGVKVFQMPSRNENMILTILPPEDSTKNSFGGQPFGENDTIEDVAKKLLGMSIYINWPHMEEAKVVAVSDEMIRYEVTEHIHGTKNKGSSHKIKKKPLSASDRKQFWLEIDGISESLLERKGIVIGETRFLVYAQPLLGRKYICSVQGQITLEKQWATYARPYPLQATVKDISVKNPNFQNFSGIEELFPVGSCVFVLGHPYYGSEGKVTQVDRGMPSLELQTPCEPDIEPIIRMRHKLSSRYYHAWELASRTGISSYLLSRITGTIFVFYPSKRKWQIGLNLRFSKESSGIAGYTKFVNREWLYSESVETTLIEYMEKFPDVLLYLQSALHRNEDEFDAMKLTKEKNSENVIEKLQQLSSWLKSLDCYHGDKINQNSDILEKNIVQLVVQKVEESKKRNSSKPFQISMRPHLLYRPMTHQGILIPDKTATHHLLDRIVNVWDSYTVPLGFRGTIIGIHQQPGNDVLYDVVFDDEFLGGLELGGRCPKRRGYRMLGCGMINISHGLRLTNKDRKPTAVVNPHPKQRRANLAWAASKGGTRYQSNEQPQSMDGCDHGTVHNSKQRNPGYFTNSAPSNATLIMQRPGSSNLPHQELFARKKSPTEKQSSSKDVAHDLWKILKKEKTKQDTMHCVDNKELSTTRSQATFETATTTNDSHPGLDEKKHLDNLFESIMASHSKTLSTPKLAFTPTQALHHTYSHSGVGESASTSQFYSNPSNHGHTSPNQSHAVSPFLVRPLFCNSGGFVPQIGMPHTVFPQPQNQEFSRDRKTSAEVGTQPLCEMPQGNKGNITLKRPTNKVEEKATVDLTPTGGDDDKTQSLMRKLDDMEIGERDSGKVSKKDEHGVEHLKSHADKVNDFAAKQKQASVAEELHLLCLKYNLAPPFYTYFSLDDAKVVSTVQLWNGMRITSPPQLSKDEATEYVARQGLALMKAEIQAYCPTSMGTSTMRNTMPVHAVASPQYFLPHPSFAQPPMFNQQFLPAAHPQYAPYVHPYPYMCTQINPGQVRQPHHQAAMWNRHFHDQSVIDRAAKSGTEMKILDKPSMQKVYAENPNEPVDAGNLDNTNATIEDGGGAKARKNKKSRMHNKQQPPSKARMAISFNKTTPPQ